VQTFWKNRRLRIGRRSDRLLLRLALPETFIVEKEEQLVLHNRSAERAAELIGFQHRPLLTSTVGEEGPT
jgi:hypothetical protein